MTADTRQTPISSHPAFRWGVGAWFALLLGLGLFVMPASVHQLIAERLGIGELVSGTALRAALSGAAALIGLLAGLALAMRVAALNRPETDDEASEIEDVTDDVWLPDDNHDDDADTDEAALEPRRPFNPREDIAEVGIGSPEDFLQDDAAPEAIETALASDEERDSHSTLMELWREELGGDADGENLPVLAGPDEAAWEEIGENSAKPHELAESEFETAGPWSAEPGIEEGETAQSEQDTVAVQPAVGPETEQAPQDPAAALGDLSLDDLTARLGSALEAFKAGPALQDEADPVIAFLRREAERDSPAKVSQGSAADPQAELRSALDKLSRVGKPK